jgi:hypothetical protein
MLTEVLYGDENVWVRENDSHFKSHFHSFFRSNFLPLSFFLFISPSLSHFEHFSLQWSRNQGRVVLLRVLRLVPHISDAKSRSLILPRSIFTTFKADISQTEQQTTYTNILTKNLSKTESSSFKGLLKFRVTKESVYVMQAETKTYSTNIIILQLNNR